MHRIINSLQNLSSILALLFRRLRYHLALTVCSAIGIISVLSLVICIPLFTNAVLSEVLKQELTEKAVQNHRSLFSIHAWYNDDTTYTPLTLSSASFVSTWLNDQLTTSMGLKVDHVFMQAMTQAFVFKPVIVNSSKQPFEDIHLYIMGDDTVPVQTKLVEGKWPSETDSSGPLQVAVYEKFADDHFLNVGDVYSAENLTVGDVYRTDNFEIEITGIFRAADTSSLDWFQSPDGTFDKVVWVPMDAFQERLPAILVRPFNHTAWYAIVDDQSLRFTNSLDYAHAMVRLDAGLHGVFAPVTIDYSPVDRLQTYESRLQSLTLLFTIAGAPLILLALIFINLTASIALRQVEQETVTLRGRGVNLAQVFMLNLVESLLLILIALPFSLLAGWLAAGLMGHAQLFLQFTRRSDLTFALKDVNGVWLAVLCLVIIASRLSPLLGLRHTTAVSYKQERSRSTKKPLWMRSYLDFLLLIAALYAWWVLRGEAKSLNIFKGLQSGGGEGQYNPLMFAASSLFTIAICMMALRLFPLLMLLLAAIVERLSGRIFPAGSYLAVQELARHPQEHASVMLLIMISLSLAVYSASMAKTLDQWLHDSQYYQSGADVVVKEYEMPLGGSSPPVGGVVSQPSGRQSAVKRVESLVSLEKHLSTPGIRSATFVGKYDGQLDYSGGQKQCTVMGIDRLSFPNTAYFRDDFASQSLGALMNLLGAQPRGVLVPQSLLDSSGLRIGDRITLSAPVGLLNQNFSAEMVIVGSYAYFPTVYPAETPTLIVNMDTLFGSAEAATGYDVWLNLEDKSGVQAVLKNLQGLAYRDLLQVDVRSNALEQIRKSMSQPEWIGLFGILSVGFLLTGLMPCIGFMLDTFATLRKLFIQLGILMAVGLSNAQMVSYLVLERLLLMGSAIAFGALSGFLTSILFIPLLQISAAAGTPVPPFRVLVGWTESTWLMAAFGAILLVTVSATIGYLVKIKIFQAVKMGEMI